MSPHRVHAALDAWRAAERHRDTLESGSTQWIAAEAAVIEAHRAYLTLVAQVEAEAAIHAPEPMGELQDSAA